VESHIFKNDLYSHQVSCSIGVASLNDHSPDKGDKLVDMADRALYQAKENGRNKVCLYDAAAEQ
jgi:diguanylate cyclase (GGDEF)-like protein